MLRLRRTTRTVRWRWQNIRVRELGGAIRFRKGSHQRYLCSCATPRRAADRCGGFGGCAGISATLKANGIPATLCGRLRTVPRSEEHTSELQSHSDLVCRLLLEKKKKTYIR